MSYDLMVFDPDIAPRDRPTFMAWFEDTTAGRGTTVFSAKVEMTGNLPQFFNRTVAEFPDLQTADFSPPAKLGFLRRLLGAKPAPPLDESMLADYVCTRNAIYMSFTWSKADLAYNRVFNYALSCGVGFFNVSGTNGEILHDPAQFEDMMGL